MSYKMPFDGSYTITASFQDHLNAGGDVAKYAGVDWAMPVGTALYAIESGKMTGQKGDFGELWVNLVSVDGHRQWQYVHLSAYNVNGGINQGGGIGWSGNTGVLTTGPHLHLGLIVDGVRVDPMTLLTPTSTGGSIAIGQYIMLEKDTNVRTGNGTTYPIQTVAKAGSVWFVKGGPRTGNNYEWFDIQACSQTDGTLGLGSGWSALRLIGGTYWAVTIPKPVPPVIDPCQIKLDALRTVYEKKLADKDIECQKKIAEVTGKAKAEVPVLEASASRLKAI
jgi:hypothetical protein